MLKEMKTIGRLVNAEFILKAINAKDCTPIIKQTREAASSMPKEELVDTHVNMYVAIYTMMKELPRDSCIYDVAAVTKKAILRRMI